MELIPYFSVLMFCGLVLETQGIGDRPSPTRIPLRSKIPVKDRTPIDLRPFQKVCGVQQFATGRPNEQEEHRYTEIGRKTGHILQWPWVVGIAGYDKEAEKYIPLCGGSIITRRYVITAAYCFYKIPTLREDDYAVEVFTYKDTSTVWVSWKKVDSYVIHPDYSPYLLYNDIAVARLKDQLEEPIMPVCLPTPNYITEDTTDKTVVVAGWGHEFESKVKLENPSHPFLFSRSVVNVIDTQICKTGYDEKRTVHLNKGIISDHICAGYPNGTNTCKSDIGSPLMLREKNDQWTLLGEYSFGRDCEDKGLPGVYTRISSYLNFIEDSIVFNS